MSEYSDAFQRSYERAQRMYDAKEQPEDWNCDEDGHQWKRSRVAYINGEYITEVKCRICGKLDVI